MSPITHLLASWVVAAAATDNPRDRRLVTLAGVLPDADGLGVLVDALYCEWETSPDEWDYLRKHLLAP